MRWFHWRNPRKHLFLRYEDVVCPVWHETHCCMIYLESSSLTCTYTYSTSSIATETTTAAACRSQASQELWRLARRCAFPHLASNSECKCLSGQAAKTDINMVEQPANMYKQGKCVYLAGLVDELIEEKGQCVSDRYKKRNHAHSLCRTSTQQAQPAVFGSHYRGSPLARPYRTAQRTPSRHFKHFIHLAFRLFAHLLEDCIRDS